MTMLRKSLPLFLLLAFGGCAFQPTQAEKATYEVIAPEHARYVQADTLLAPDQKQRRLDLLEAWRIRVGAGK